MTHYSFSVRSLFNKQLRYGLIVGIGLATFSMPAFADILCPNFATQGGFGGTFTNFNGTLDPSCSYMPVDPSDPSGPRVGSGVTISLPSNTDYGKLEWDATNVANYPTSLTLSNLASLSASVEFNTAQTDTPYFQLAFQDTGGVFASTPGVSPGDQFLAITFGATGLSSTMFSTMTFDPSSTLVHIYDNTTSTDLLGGIGGAETLDAFLAGALAPDAGASVDQIRLATGLAGGCDTSVSCAETLSIDSVNFEITPTPEPSTFVLVGLGIAGFSFLRRKRDV